MLGGQILKLIFVINRKHPELTIIHKPIVDDPQATSSALATSCIRPAYFSEATSPRYYVARRWIALQIILQLPILIVRQVTTNARSEYCGFKNTVRMGKL